MLSSAAILLLSLLATPVAAFTLASAPLAPCARVATSGLCAVRMQADAPEPEPPAATPGASSPLAGFAANAEPTSLSKKEEDNAKRNELRAKINIFLPLTFFGCFGIASFIGEDKVKGSLAGAGDPLANAPGVTEAREKKKERVAKVRSTEIIPLRPSLLLRHSPVEFACSRLCSAQ